MSAHLDRPWLGGTSPYAGLRTRRTLRLGLREHDAMQPLDGGFKPRLFWRGVIAFALLLVVCSALGIETAP